MEDDEAWHAPGVCFSEYFIDDLITQLEKAKGLVKKYKHKVRAAKNSHNIS